MHEHPLSFVHKSRERGPTLAPKRLFGAALLALLSGAASLNCGIGSSTDTGADDEATAVQASPVVTPARVTTSHNDLSRTGANLNEQILTPSNIPIDQFGKLFARPVDGQIYAQPLYLPSKTIPGKGTHNVVYVATMNDSVYAFDADDPAQSQPLWKRSFLSTGVVPAYQSDVGSNCGTYRDITGNIGILSTPVIDETAGTIYVVAKTKDSNGQQTYKLHALDVTTGAERTNSPVTISASVAGTGNGSVNGRVAFQAAIQNQRAGLALANGRVYIAFASYCDTGDYHGWVLGYDQTTLAQTSAYNTTPNGGEGGIWMSGQAPTVDASGNLYVVTGNGTFDGDTGQPDLGGSLIKLDRNLQRLDWFAPHNVRDINDADLDLGSGGALLLSGLNQLVIGGKEGIVYALNPGSLTHFNPTVDQIPQEFPIFDDGTLRRNIHGSPVTWQVNGRTRIYLWAEDQHLKSYEYSNGSFHLVSTSTVAVPEGMPGAMLSISANGTTASTGIVWAVHPLSGDANNAPQAGILRAFDARDLTNVIWDSHLKPGRDDMGNLAKFTPPTVANGKVYLATFSNQLVVYGRGNFTGTCSNGVRDGSETAIDCGGSCQPCADKVFYCPSDDAIDTNTAPFVCDLQLPRKVVGIGLSVGCNDAETGVFTVSFDGGTVQQISSACNSSFTVVPAVTTQHATLKMVSGGGDDNRISLYGFSVVYD